MRYPRKRGSTSVMIRIFIPNNSSSIGNGLTGLTNTSTNLAITYSRELQNGFTQITGANLATITTIGTWANPGTGKLGFKAVDATNAPGLYEIHFPNDATAFGTGDLSQAIYVNILELTTSALYIGPNMVLIPLVPWDYQDGTRMGLTALPSAAADAAGGLPISDAGGLDLDAKLANTDEITATRLAKLDEENMPTDINTIMEKTNLLPDGVAKNTVLENFMFLMVSSSDHVTPKTGLTITAERSVDGAAFSATANSASELSAGIYKIDLAATDLNGNVICFKFTATGADARFITIKTQT